MSADTNTNQVAIASYGRAIASALEQRGIEASAVFKRAGVPMPHTVDPLRRMSNAQISALFRESVEITRDPYFGLFVAETFQISQLHVLGFALLTSSTLRDFFLRLQNYYRLASRNADFRLEESDEETILVGHTTQPDICSETVDAFAGVMVKLMRTIAEKNFAPKWVELRRPKPAQGDKPYRDYFCCEVLFDTPEVRICIDSKLIDLPLPGASLELAQMHDRTAAEYLEKLERQSIPNRVRSLIVESLATGLVSKQLVADRL